MGKERYGLTGVGKCICGWALFLHPEPDEAQGQGRRGEGNQLEGEPAGKEAANSTAPGGIHHPPHSAQEMNPTCLH